MSLQIRVRAASASATISLESLALCRAHDEVVAGLGADLLLDLGQLGPAGLVELLAGRRHGSRPGRGLAAGLNLADGVLTQAAGVADGQEVLVGFLGRIILLTLLASGGDDEPGAAGVGRQALCQGQGGLFGLGVLPGVEPIQGLLHGRGAGVVPAAQGGGQRAGLAARARHIGMYVLFLMFYSLAFSSAARITRMASIFLRSCCAHSTSSTSSRG